MDQPVETRRGRSGGELTPAAARRNLELRNATETDIPAIVELSRRVYPGEVPYSRGQIRGQINAFPEGQFVVTYDGEVVGYAATFIVSERLALADHRWETITGGGFAARHDAEGEWLYGMEVCVDRARRRLRIGQRLLRRAQAAVRGSRPQGHRLRRPHPGLCPPPAAVSAAGGLSGGGDRQGSARPRRLVSGARRVRAGAGAARLSAGRCRVRRPRCADGLAKPVLSGA